MEAIHKVSRSEYRFPLGRVLLFSDTKVVPCGTFSLSQTYLKLETRSNKFSFGSPSTDQPIELYHYFRLVAILRLHGKYTDDWEKLLPRLLAIYVWNKKKVAQLSPEQESFPDRQRRRRRRSG